MPSLGEGFCMRGLLKVPAAPDDSAEYAMLVELAPGNNAVWVFAAFIVVAAENPVADWRLY